MSNDVNRTPPATLLIGPGIESWDPDCAEPHCAEEPPQVRGRRLFLRLVVAFFVLLLVALLCLVAPRAGIPPWVPLAAFGVIAISVLVNARSEDDSPDVLPAERDSGGCCDGRPVGCCPGPRPPQFLREPPRRR
jgi:hypothetical protein